MQIAKHGVIAAIAVALPFWPLRASAQDQTLSRPEIYVGPKNVVHPRQPSPPRSTKTCHVHSSGDGDDAPAILSAFHKCNHGGTVVLDKNYTIASPLDLTFLDSVDVALVGTINFTDDMDYWVEKSFKYAYQDSSTFWRFGGTDVNIFGNGVGVINGNAQVWYQEAPMNSTLLRPILFVTDGLHGGSISGITMINSPNWFNLIANSSDIVISDMYLHAYSTNSSVRPRNTDGWDTLRSNSIVIQNSRIDNTDDCVSFKPNSTDIIVQGLQCSGSHGISVGSLGQYVGEIDIVENIYVYNISMSNATDGARLKVWPGIPPGVTATNVGGGSGYVRNITYEDFGNHNNDLAIQVNQCYGADNQTICNQYPSNMTMSDVYIIDMYGTTSSKYDPEVGTLICSAPEKCLNFNANNITVTPPSGNDPKWICSGFDTSGLEGFDCVPA